MFRKILIFVGLLLQVTACHNPSEVAQWSYTQAWDKEEDRPAVMVCDYYGNCKRPIRSTDGYSN